ncbi:hypothetical protein D3C83_238380 [compost metagenome]
MPLVYIRMVVSASSIAASSHSAAALSTNCGKCAMPGVSLSRATKVSTLDSSSRSDSTSDT